MMRMIVMVMIKRVSRASNISLSLSLSFAHGGADGIICW